MADYDNKLTGALFKNDKKGNEKAPEYKGNFTDENGKEFNVSAWIKESKKGEKFMSLSFQAKEKKDQAHTPKKEYKDEVGIDGEPLPF